MNRSRVRVLSAALAAALSVTACSEGSAAETAAPTAPPTSAAVAPPTAAPPTTIALSADEREWCSFTGDTEADARRFDQIFEAGLGLQLNMDAINARGAGLRAELEAAGMSPDEAVRAVSDALFEEPDFVAACASAYVRFAGSAQGA